MPQRREALQCRRGFGDGARDCPTCVRPVTNAATRDTLSISPGPKDFGFVTKQLPDLPPMKTLSPLGHLFSLFPGLCATLCAATLTAQCAPNWLPGEGCPGVDGGVNATLAWDPDGAGPLPSRLVVGGLFETAGNVAASNIASADPLTGVWSSFGSGMSGAGTLTSVSALAVLPSGDLVAAGTFTSAGGVAANNIALWNGTTWAPLGSGTNGDVGALLVLPNGNLVVGGSFTSAGGVAASQIAIWNGATWSALGSGLTGVFSYVAALAVLGNGDLVAAGRFSSAGGVAANNIAAWNGTTWSPLGTGTNADIEALAVLPNGALVAGGAFGVAGGVSALLVAQWNGVQWSSIGFAGSGSSSLVRALTVLPSGDLVAGGSFFGFPSGSGNVARWDGTSWSAFDSGVVGQIASLAVMPNGDLIAGGELSNVGSTPVRGVVRWDGTMWRTLCSGVGGFVFALSELPGGDLVAGGTFANAGGSANNIARRSGSSWSALGGGVDGSVFTIATLPNGDVVAGGVFANAGGFAASRIARWNGSVWTPLGTGIDGSSGTAVNALVVLANGDLVAGGSFATAGGVAASNIARWNGTSWSPFSVGANGAVSSLLRLSNGDLLVGGGFTSIGGVAANRIARWNGSTWSPLGVGTNGAVASLAQLPNGDIVASGSFQSAGGLAVSNVARWNGSAWSSLGAGLDFGPGVQGSSVSALAVLPGGDLVAGGYFTNSGGAPLAYLARWNGVAWSALGSGVDGWIFALHSGSRGELAVGGLFATAGGQQSAFLARYATPCPASSLAFGAACVGGGGAASYAAVTLPWAGSTYRTRGTGLPQQSFVAVVNGFSAVNVPLAAVLPPSPVGCALLASPDFVAIAAPTGGVVDAQLDLPNSATLAGFAWHQQLVALEVDASLQFVQSTSTNKLIAVIGSF